MLETVLSRIDSQYSQKYHLGMLKFLAQSVVSYGQLESCNGVPEVYKKLETKLSDPCVAVALLRHMLRATGYENKADLQNLNDHCADEFNLKTVAPSLPFYELLLIFVKKLQRNKRYRRFLEFIDENKLDKSKHDVSSPVDMLQSMIHKGTIAHDDLSTLNELINPLNELEMLEEATFLKQSLIQSTECDGENSIVLASYFNFEGQLQQLNDYCEHNTVLNIQEVSYKTIETVWTDQELRPLLDTEPVYPDVHERRNCFKVHQKLCCLASGASFLVFVLFFSGFVTFIYFGKAPVLNQTQPVYGDIAYSPFSKLDNRYNHIEFTLHYDRESVSNKFNLTICQASCPLKTHIKKIVFNGSCPVERPQHNCNAKLDEKYVPQDSNPKCFSKFMLKNSKVRFKIDTSHSDNNSVQLCITTNKDKCKDVYWSIARHTQSELQQICLKLVTFNRSNNFTQTFTAPDDSYYCAVWVLEKGQWLNYTVNLSIETYNITDYLPHLCESHNERPSHITFPVRPSKPTKAVCIVLQQNTVEHWDDTPCDSLTINSTAFKPLSTGAWAAFSVMVGLIFVFSILISFTIIFCMIKLCIVQR